MAASSVDDFAKKIREVKNLVNVEWENKAHPGAVEDQVGIAAFDQIMDQVFNLVECYQQVVQDTATVPEGVLQKASDAHIESVKAACGFLENIASRLVERAKQMVQQQKPASEQMLRLNQRVNECKDKIEDARHLWEQDRPEGLDELKRIIREMDRIIDDISLALPAAVEAVERTRRDEVRAQVQIGLTRWGLRARWAGIILAFLMGLVSLIISLSRRS